MQYTVALTFASHNTPSSIATKWAVHHLRFLEWMGGALAFQHADGTALPQCNMDTPPVESEWDDILTSSTITNGRTRIEFGFRTDVTVHSGGQTSPQMRTWWMDHASFLNNTHITEVYLQQSRAGYKTVARCANSNLANGMAGVKAELIARLCKEHGNHISPAQFDIAWVRHPVMVDQVELMIGIVEVVTPEDADAEVEEAIFMLQDTGARR
jgi:hypothetical protein